MSRGPTPADWALKRLGWKPRESEAVWVRLPGRAPAWCRAIVFELRQWTVKTSRPLGAVGGSSCRVHHYDNVYPDSEREARMEGEAPE